jgi:asparagine synthase (glutamine-hydrolysing)
LPGTAVDRDSIAAALSSMMEVMAHRGPDDSGEWLAPARVGGGPGRCALGHRRLAIIDPHGGRQPMSNDDGSVVLIFNGCIYNHLDLARHLRELGHRLHTSSDTEVILRAYEEWGPACVDRFNGMWALAIWDSRLERLFCSRDRVGIKPFYWAMEGGRFIFASEIKAILAARAHFGAVGPALDDDGLRQYLTFQFCLGETTMFAGVRRLEPGCNLVVEFASVANGGARPQISRYWALGFAVDESGDEAYFVDQTRWLFEDAIRLQLRSDVPLGAHLSGGLDSSAVVCAARKLLGAVPLKTFTGAFAEGPAFDETRYAREVAQHAGAECLEVWLGADQFAASIERIVWHMDEPAAGPGVFPQYWLSKLASEHVKVVLGGQGGDEIFIGYARYLVAYLEECLRGAIENTAHRGHYVATLETIVPSLPTLEQYVPMLRGFWRDGLFDEPASRYFRLMDRFADSRALLVPDVRPDHRRTYEEFRAIFDGSQAGSARAMINRILSFDLATHLQSLLHVEDRTSMAWGLESRVPLLDHRLIELVAAAPPVIKFKNGRLKHLFRQAVQNLVPSAIIDRRDKMGFPVPINQWMSGPLRGFMAEALLDRTSRERGLWEPAAIEAELRSERPFSRALWGALMLELWHRTFLDGQHVAGVTRKKPAGQQVDTSTGPSWPRAC